MIKVRYFKRGVSWFLDYFICQVVIYAVIGLLWMKMSNEESIETSLLQMPKDSALILGFIAIIITVFYYFIIPAFFMKNQTIAKRIFNIKIISNTKNKLSIKQLFLRQVIGLLFIDAYLSASTIFIIQLLEINLNADIAMYFEIYFMLMTIISVALTIFSAKHLAIHDWLAKTDIIEEGEK
ncbi:MAG: RDD family protein [Anaerorhabdus sp.]